SRFGLPQGFDRRVARPNDRAERNFHNAMLFGLCAFASDDVLFIIEVEDWDRLTGPPAISTARSFPEYAGCGAVFGVFWFEVRQAAVRACRWNTTQLTNDQSSRHSGGKLDQCVRHVGV